MRKTVLILIAIFDIAIVSGYAYGNWIKDESYVNSTYLTETRYENNITGEIMYDPGYTYVD